MPEQRITRQSADVLQGSAFLPNHIHVTRQSADVLQRSVFLLNPLRVTRQSADVLQDRIFPANVCRVTRQSVEVALSPVLQLGHRLKFGSYEFPGTFHVSREQSSRRVASSKTPRFDGGRTAQGLLDLKKFGLVGTMFRPMGVSVADDTLRTLMAALKAGLGEGPAKFTIEGDRYWRLCQAEGYSDDYDPTSLYNYVNVSVEIVSGDPFAYQEPRRSSCNRIDASGDTIRIDAGGNAFAAPTFALRVAGVGAVALSATLSNLTTGESCTLTGSVVGGNNILVDTLLESVTIGGVDEMSLFEGVFPTLALGVNVLEIDWTSGGIDRLTVGWNDRWY